MKLMLLGLAASTAIIIPVASASAQDSRSALHRLSGEVASAQSFCGETMRSHGDGHRDVRCMGGTYFDYGGEWAYYNNRAWAPDSYNDWWHDRPDRAYPAWVRHNENCDRRWFAGDTLRC